jgi:hypothetical protein
LREFVDTVPNACDGIVAIDWRRRSCNNGGGGRFATDANHFRVDVGVMSSNRVERSFDSVKSTDTPVYGYERAATRRSELDRRRPWLRSSRPGRNDDPLLDACRGQTARDH